MSVRNSRPLAASHSFSVLSSLPETIDAPVRRECDGRHRSVRCPVSVRSGRPLAASHSFTVLSTARGNDRASVRRERDGVRKGRCPLRVRSSRPLAASHTFRSSAPETMVRPSGENATLPSSWPYAP